MVELNIPRCRELIAKLRDLPSEIKALKADADRYRWLRDHQCNQLILSRNEDPASNYVTAKEWIEDFVPNEFVNTDPDRLQRMKDSNTIWRLQIYPSTPVGFDVMYGSTLDEAVNQAWSRSR